MSEYSTRGTPPGIYVNWRDPVFTTWGSCRDGCGHEHKTLKEAVECLRRDQRDCASQGVYSDREIYAGDPGLSHVESSVNTERSWGPRGARIAANLFLRQPKLATGDDH